MTITIPDFSRTESSEELALLLERFLREFMYRLNTELEKRPTRAEFRREQNGTK